MFIGKRLPRVAEKLVHDWRAYWFAPRGARGIAIARIAVASSVLIALPSYAQPDYHAYLQAQDPALYQPEGILNLLGSSAPPAAFFEGVKIAAYVATVCALVGLCTRISMAVSFISFVVLTSFTYSFIPGWCHGANFIHLAQLALLFGRTGDMLSIDSLLRRGRGGTSLREHEDRGDYWWPLLLAQWAIGLGLANAAYWKLRSGGVGLGWPLSDNMRNILVLQYYFLGDKPSELVSWIMAEEWRYKAVAVGNLVAQCLPLLACDFVRRPLLRAFFGAFFILEMIGLRVVMGPAMVNYAWIPLYALFIDWDRLILRLRGSKGSEAPPAGLGQGPRPQAVAPAPIALLTSQVLAILFILSFLEYYAFVAFTCSGCENRTYPFSSFPMYCEVMAKRPFAQHQTYECPWVRFELEANSTDAGKATWWVVANYSYLGGVEDLDEVKRTLETIQRFLIREDARFHYQPSALGFLEPDYRFRVEDLKRITLKKVIFQIPSYPAPPSPTVVREGLVASWDDKDGFRGVAATSKWDPAVRRSYLDVTSAGYNDPRFRFAYLVDDAGEPRPLEVTKSGRRYYYDRREAGVYRFIIYVTDSSRGTEEDVYLR
jgi:hypothetical protein